MATAAPIRPAPRRWASMVSLGLGLALFFAVFPNPLRNPQTNPTASAEYAPVPGRQQSAPNANFGETGLASSGGVGAGGDGVGLLPGQLPPKPPPILKPRQKNCYGKPPRQTVDPLSPPCVAFFDGDNGGKTYNGVSKDAIEIVLYNDLAVEGDMTTPWRPSDEKPDHQASQNGQDTYLVRTIKAQLRYFQERFQTYGRRVHVVAQRSGNGLATKPEQRAGDAIVTKDTFQPFAAVHFGDGGANYMEQLGKYRIPSFGINADVERKQFTSSPGLVWGFFPEQETEAALSAGFICRKLKGRPAKFAYDENLQNRERRFGIIYPTESDRGPEAMQLAQKLIAYTRQRCGMEWGADGPNFIRTLKKENAGESNTVALIMQRFKAENVTTVICYCVPVQTELTISRMQNAATSLDYFPEWFYDHGNRMFRAVWNQRFAEQSGRHRGFGVSYHWRQPAFEQQYHYQAYLQEEPGTRPNTRFNFDLYHVFRTPVQPLQAAGPRPSTESVKRGMFTFFYNNPRNPLVPTGGYGDWGDRAAGDYTWIDTAMGFWWDPEGTPPGGRPGEGCLRLMDQGRRYFADTWPQGDSDLFVERGAPCTQDDTEIDPEGPGGF